MSYALVPFLGRLRRRPPGRSDRFTADHQMAMSQLYDQYAPVVFGILLNRANDRVVAGRMLQKVFVRAGRELSTGGPVAHRPLTRLLALTRTVGLPYHAGQLTSLSRLFSSVTFRGSAPAQPAGRSGLTPDLQQVLELVYVHGYSLQEVADQLDLPLATVQARIRQAFRQLATVGT